ncbi:allophanate hydrolase subunit 1 [Kineosporia rhizophila]|uniref:5-oxoprolinase subunit B family protein n=1 Tax=Kineosporia rhizophila TaxID=84633 RepID=UPI001E3A9275|nr:allophanate hydrolase subunit 1 [Kineosporia rhizophila]MCE0534352.1 allophanate hydrolase subunit 1 [Kineosporia rhizophila]
MAEAVAGWMGRVRRAGECGYLVELPEGDPAQVAERVRVIAGERGTGLVEVVPGLSTVLVVLGEPMKQAAFETLLAEVGSVTGDRVGPAGSVVIDVRYDGPDLAEVASLTGLDEQQVVELHASTEFRAAFSGFAPGFVYLTGVPEQMKVPRRSEPRAAVPSGSVALADQFTAVYPQRSPGGWQLIGTTEQRLWDLGQDPPALIRPGMTVRFRPVS